MPVQSLRRESLMVSHILPYKQNLDYRKLMTLQIAVPPHHLWWGPLWRIKSRW